MATNLVTNFKTTLSTGLASGGSETTIDLASVTTTDDHTLTMADIGDIGFIVINPNGSTIEVCSFTGISSTTLTGVTRGLPFYGSSLTAVTANKKAHGAGETVIISNNHHWFSEQYAAVDNSETISGQWTFSTVPTASSDPVSGSDLARRSWVLSNINGGAVSQDKVVVTATAGETVAAGNLVYMNTSDGEWYKTDADTSTTVQNVLLGIAQGAGTDGVGISGGVLIKGVDTNQSGMTIGALQYASGTAGAISGTAGGTTKVIGAARTATNLYFDPYFYEVPGVPAGSISMYGAASAPTGWLLCDGSAVSRTTYARLFATLSTSYGTGDGSTTFNVPNFKSRVPVGYGQGTLAFNFATTDVNTGTDTITVSSNLTLYHGKAVTLSSSGTLPAGLSPGTYYIIRSSATAVKLASSANNAMLGTAVDLTDTGSGTHTITITYTNRALGAVGGEETHIVRGSELGAASVNFYNAATSGGTVGFVGAGTGSSLGSDTSVFGNSSSGSNVMNPFVVVNYIIKY